MEVVAKAAAYKKEDVADKEETANEEEARLRKCLSWDRCKLYCPDGGKMKTGKTKMGRRKRFCEKNGKPHGLTTSWHDNGQLAWERTFENGKVHELETRWYENGKLWSKRIYKNGRIVKVHFP